MPPCHRVACCVAINYLSFPFGSSLLRRVEEYSPRVCVCVDMKGGTFWNTSLFRYRVTIKAFFLLAWPKHIQKVKVKRERKGKTSLFRRASPDGARFGVACNIHAPAEELIFRLRVLSLNASRAGIFRSSSHVWRALSDELCFA